MNFWRILNQCHGPVSKDVIRTTLKEDPKMRMTTGVQRVLNILTILYPLW